VFVGYGMTDKAMGYDDYEGLMCAAESPSS
jgi:hypothetical protein